MNPPASTGSEDFGSFEAIVENDDVIVCDLPDLQQIQRQEQYRQHRRHGNFDPEYLEQLLEPNSQSVTTLQNRAADPNMRDIQPQIVSQAPSENLNLHREQSTLNSDAQNEPRHFQERLRELEYQANAKALETQFPREFLQPDPQYQTEMQCWLHSERQLQQKNLLDLCAAEGITLISEAQHQEMLKEVHRHQRCMENIPPPQLFPEFSNPPTFSQHLESNNALIEDMEVDEIQPNIPLEETKQENPRQQQVPMAANPNQHTRQSVSKNSNDNSNRMLTVGSASNVDNANALMMANPEALVKCPSCESRFVDLRQVRLHFRKIHARQDTESNICRECLTEFPSKSKLKRHWECTHEGELMYVCDACGARFNKSRNLTWHWAKMHPGELQL